MKYNNIHEEKKKGEILSTLELMCAFMVHRRGTLTEELEKIKLESRRDDDDEYMSELRKQE